MSTDSITYVFVSHSRSLDQMGKASADDQRNKLSATSEPSCMEDGAAVGRRGTFSLIPLNERSVSADVLSMPPKDMGDRQRSASLDQSRISQIDLEPELTPETVFNSVPQTDEQEETETEMKPPQEEEVVVVYRKNRKSVDKSKRVSWGDRSEEGDRVEVKLHIKGDDGTTYPEETPSHLTTPRTVRTSATCEMAIQTSDSLEELRDQGKIKIVKVGNQSTMETQTDDGESIPAEIPTPSTSDAQTSPIPFDEEASEVIETVITPTNISRTETNALLNEALAKLRTAMGSQTDISIVDIREPTEGTPISVRHLSSEEVQTGDVTPDVSSEVTEIAAEISEEIRKAKEQIANMREEMAAPESPMPADQPWWLPDATTSSTQTDPALAGADEDTGMEEGERETQAAEVKEESKSGKMVKTGDMEGTKGRDMRGKEADVQTDTELMKENAELGKEDVEGAKQNVESVKSEYRDQDVQEGDMELVKEGNTWKLFSRESLTRSRSTRSVASTDDGAQRDKIEMDIMIDANDMLDSSVDSSVSGHSSPIHTSSPLPCYEEQAQTPMEFFPLASPNYKEEITTSTEFYESTPDLSEAEDKERRTTASSPDLSTRNTGIAIQTDLGGEAFDIRDAARGVSLSQSDLRGIGQRPHSSEQLHLRDNVTRSMTNVTAAGQQYRPSYFSPRDVHFDLMMNRSFHGSVVTLDGREVARSIETQTYPEVRYIETQTAEEKRGIVTQTSIEDKPKAPTTITMVDTGISPSPPRGYSPVEFAIQTDDVTEVTTCVTAQITAQVTAASGRSTQESASCIVSDAVQDETAPHEESVHPETDLDSLGAPQTKHEQSTSAAENRSRPGTSTSIAVQAGHSMLQYHDISLSSDEDEPLSAKIEVDVTSYPQKEDEVDKIPMRKPRSKTDPEPESVPQYNFSDPDLARLRREHESIMALFEKSKEEREKSIKKRRELKQRKPSFTSSDLMTDSVSSVTSAESDSMLSSSAHSSEQSTEHRQQRHESPVKVLEDEKLIESPRVSSSEIDELKEIEAKDETKEPQVEDVEIEKVIKINLEASVKSNKTNVDVTRVNVIDREVIVVVEKDDDEEGEVSTAQSGTGRTEQPTEDLLKSQEVPTMSSPHIIQHKTTVPVETPERDDNIEGDAQAKRKEDRTDAEGEASKKQQQRQLEDRQAGEGETAGQPGRTEAEGELGEQIDTAFQVPHVDDSEDRSLKPADIEEIQTQEQAEEFEKTAELEKPKDQKSAEKVEKDLEVKEQDETKRQTDLKQDTKEEDTTVQDISAQDSKEPNIIELIDEEMKENKDTKKEQDVEDSDLKPHIADHPSTDEEVKDLEVDTQIREPNVQVKEQEELEEEDYVRKRALELLTESEMIAEQEIREKLDRESSSDDDQRRDDQDDTLQTDTTAADKEVEELMSDKSSHGSREDIDENIHERIADTKHPARADRIDILLTQQINLEENAQVPSTDSGLVDSSAELLRLPRTDVEQSFEKPHQQKQETLPRSRTASTQYDDETERPPSVAASVSTQWDDEDAKRLQALSPIENVSMMTQPDTGRDNRTSSPLRTREDSDISHIIERYQTIKKLVEGDPTALLQPQSQQTPPRSVNTTSTTATQYEEDTKSSKTDSSSRKGVSFGTSTDPIKTLSPRSHRSTDSISTIERMVSPTNSEMRDESISTDFTSMEYDDELERLRRERQRILDMLAKDLIPSKFQVELAEAQLNYIIGQTDILLHNLDEPTWDFDQEKLRKYASPEAGLSEVSKEYLAKYRQTLEISKKQIEEKIIILEKERDSHKKKRQFAKYKRDAAREAFLYERQREQNKHENVKPVASLRSQSASPARSSAGSLDTSEESSQTGSQVPPSPILARFLTPKQRQHYLTKLRKGIIKSTKKEEEDVRSRSKSPSVPQTPSAPVTPANTYSLSAAYTSPYLAQRPTLDVGYGSQNAGAQTTSLGRGRAQYRTPPYPSAGQPRFPSFSPPRRALPDDAASVTSSLDEDTARLLGDAQEMRNLSRMEIEQARQTLDSPRYNSSALHTR